MKKRWALLWALVMVALLGGCAREQMPEEAQSTMYMGFSQLGSESSWRLGNTASMERAAREQNITLMVDNANQKQEKQIDAIRSFIAYQVDIISFSPIVEDGWDNVLIEARDAGIPVVVVDRLVNTEDETLYDAFIGADFYAEGVRAGEYLLRKADDLGKDQLRIVEIAGTVDATPTLKRHSGFHDTIDGDRRFTTLETISGDFIVTKGAECMRYLIEKYAGDIDVMYSHNDAMTLGAIEAIEEQGLVPGTDIIIITVDGEQATIDLLKEGKINCVVECTPMLGEIVMDVAQKLYRGETVPRVIHPEERVFTEYDDLTEIEPRGY